MIAKSYSENTTDYEFYTRQIDTMIARYTVMWHQLRLTGAKTLFKKCQQELELLEFIWSFLISHE